MVNESTDYANEESANEPIWIEMEIVAKWEMARNNEKNSVNSEKLVKEKLFINLQTNFPQ